MTPIRITRTLRIPDPVRISRYRKAPEFGPRLLFFSGGSALTGLSRTLKAYTHNSIHLVTPFDSGGSSAKLRAAFQMPSIGDLRSRLTALADESVTGHPEIYRLFTFRLPVDQKPAALRKQLEALVKGKAPLIAEISNPMRRLICHQLGWFLQAMPEGFDLRGASIGNLILAGGYLNNHQHLDPIIFLFSKLVNVQGTVRALVNTNLHLAAELEDGSLVLGQHRLTGKEAPPLESPIQRLLLSQRLDRYQPAETALRKKTRKLIQNAELICYPPGSFYTSLLANLMPQGVGEAIVANGCPKVYIPNLGRDPEQIGMSANRQFETLIGQLLRNPPAETPVSKVLNFVLLDRANGADAGDLDPALLERHGVQLVDTPLVSKQSAPYYDDELLVSALLSMV